MPAPLKDLSALSLTCVHTGFAQAVSFSLYCFSLCSSVSVLFGSHEATSVALLAICVRAAVCPFDCPSAHPYVRPSVNLCVPACPPIRPSIRARTPVRPCDQLSVCLSVRQCGWPAVCVAGCVALWRVLICAESSVECNLAGTESTTRVSHHDPCCKLCRAKDNKLSAAIEAKSSSLTEAVEKGRMNREAKQAQEASIESLYEKVRGRGGRGEAWIDTLCQPQCILFRFG